MTVHLEVLDAVAVLTIDRPDVRNAIDEPTMDALGAHLDTLDRTPETRVVVLTATGNRAFSAGGDLKWFADLETSAAGRTMSEKMRAITDRLSEGARPLITAANGSAIGGGLELFLCGHVRVASTAALFAFRQAAIGVVTGWGGGVRALRALGSDRARMLWLTGREIDAATARDCGLVHDVVPPPDVRAHGIKIATTIAAAPTQAIAGFLDLTRTWTHDGAAAPSGGAEHYAQTGRLGALRWREPYSAPSSGPGSRLDKACSAAMSAVHELPYWRSSVLASPHTAGRMLASYSARILWLTLMP